MEEQDMTIELTAKDVAAAFGVKPDTVGSWVREKRLASTLPRNARRLGRRYTVAAVLTFAQSTQDDGYTLRQFEAWWARNRTRFGADSEEGSSELSTLVLNCT